MNAMPGSFSRQEGRVGYVVRAFHLTTLSSRDCMVATALGWNSWHMQHHARDHKTLGKPLNLSHAFLGFVKCVSLHVLTSLKSLAFVF